jgi:hypothetical protein
MQQAMGAASSYPWSEKIGQINCTAFRSSPRQRICSIMLAYGSESRWMIRTRIRRNHFLHPCSAAMSRSGKSNSEEDTLDKMQSQQGSRNELQHLELESKKEAEEAD